jgi:hypothetical protein
MTAKLCDLCQKNTAQWRWWVRDGRKSPIARLMDLCHDCEELDSVRFITRGNMPIVDAEVVPPIFFAELRTKFALMFDRLIAAARAEGRAESAEDNAALASVASQLLEVSSRPPPPRKD